MSLTRQVFPAPSPYHHNNMTPAPSPYHHNNMTAAEHSLYGMYRTRQPSRHRKRTFQLSRQTHASRHSPLRSTQSNQIHEMLYLGNINSPHRQTPISSMHSSPLHRKPRRPHPQVNNMPVNLNLSPRQAGRKRSSPMDQRIAMADSMPLRDSSRETVIPSAASSQETAPSLPPLHIPTSNFPQPSSEFSPSYPLKPQVPMRVLSHADNCHLDRRNLIHTQHHLQ